MKDYEKLSQTYYNKIADRFDYSIDGLFSYPFKKMIAHELTINSGERVLDVGCANGRLLSLLNRKRIINGYGIDISEQFIEIAKKNYPQFKFYQGSALKLPFPDDFFNLLICSASFHHFPEPEAFLEEAKRVLRKGGRLIIAEINIPIFLNLYNQYIDKYNQEGDVKVYSLKELTALLKQNGWQIIRKRVFFQIQYYELVANISKSNL